jgi:hypothetical protein
MHQQGVVMPRRYPDRRRIRPGRRPPNRFSNKGAPPPGPGFTGYGFGSFYRVLLPGLRGRGKRGFFNKVSDYLVLGVGLGGALVGGTWAGPVGAVVGLGAGLAVGSALAVRGGYYRP